MHKKERAVIHGEVMHTFRKKFITIYPIVFCVLFTLLATNYFLGEPKLFTLHGQPIVIYLIAALALLIEFLIIVRHQSKIITVTAIINFCITFLLTAYPLAFAIILATLIIASYKNLARQLGGIFGLLAFLYFL